MGSLIDKLVSLEHSTELHNLIIGKLYGIWNIYRPYFPKSHCYGENIPTHKVYAIYIGNDNRNYYFKETKNLYLSSQDLDFAGTPYELTNNDADIVIPRNGITGAIFNGSGHNHWFDRYEYSQSIELLEEEKLSKYRMVTEWYDIRKPIKGTTGDLMRFNEIAIKNYSNIVIINVAEGTTKTYEVNNIEVGINVLTVRNTNETILTLSKLMDSIIVERGNILRIAIGG